MMLMATRDAEIDGTNRHIIFLTRRRFAALARCDAATARKFQSEIVALKNRRCELLYGPPLIP